MASASRSCVYPAASLASLIRSPNKKLTGSSDYIVIREGAEAIINAIILPQNATDQRIRGPKDGISGEGIDTISCEGNYDNVGAHGLYVMAWNEGDYILTIKTCDGSNISKDVHVRVVSEYGWFTDEQGNSFHYSEKDDKSWEYDTGWTEINGQLHYFDENGHFVEDVVDGFATINGKTYYCKERTKIKGWKQISGKWFFFNASGEMRTGWVKNGAKWYYMSSTGTMQTGWQKINKKWYYFKSSGEMAANEWCKGYWLNKDGTWTYKKKASWRKDQHSWWYGCSGWYARNQWQKIDNKWYYFDSMGYIVTGNKTFGGKTYRFDNNGECLNP